MHCYKLFIEKIETIVKLHTYYIINIKTEMNYIQSNISKKKLYQIFNKSLNYNNDDNDNDDNDKDNNEINKNENNKDFIKDKEEIFADYNKIIIENYFDLNN